MDKQPTPEYLPVNIAFSGELVADAANALELQQQIRDYFVGLGAPVVRLEVALSTDVPEQEEASPDLLRAETGEQVSASQPEGDSSRASSEGDQEQNLDSDIDEALRRYKKEQILDLDIDEALRRYSGKAKGHRTGALKHDGVYTVRDAFVLGKNYVSGLREFGLTNLNYLERTLAIACPDEQWNAESATIDEIVRLCPSLDMVPSEVIGIRWPGRNTIQDLLTQPAENFDVSKWLKFGNKDHAERHAAASREAEAKAREFAIEYELAQQRLRAKRG
jgi:hypothetical protein